MVYTFQTAGHIMAGCGAFRRTAEQLSNRLKVQSVFILSQPSMLKQGHLKHLSEDLAKYHVDSEICLDIKPEPTEENIEAVFRSFQSKPYDAIIAVGGGSVLDAAKVLSVLSTNSKSIREMLGIDLIRQPGLPTILIPTTSGTGSEVTPNAIVTIPEDELKIGMVSRHLLPFMAVLDPLLTLELPKPITAATGMDALTHAIESFISNKSNPMSDLFALESIRRISRSIVRAFEQGDDVTAREDMLMGSMYGGMALTGSGTAAVHAMAYPIGGRFQVPHGVANSMLLPHVMEYNLDAIIERVVLIAKAMELQVERLDHEQIASSVLEQIQQWTKVLDIPQDLKPFGVKEQHVPDLAVAASKVTRLMDNNPKPLSIRSIEAIYRKLI